MDWSWLALLLCPLMMLPMILMMMKGNHSETKKHDHEKNLAQELEKLRIQNETMQRELQDMKNKL